MKFHFCVDDDYGDDDDDDDVDKTLNLLSLST